MARQCQRRECYKILDHELYEEFKSRFPYSLTIDQREAIKDIYSDMIECDAPMERLICGDVGFGKTEAAMHGIFLAAHAGRQVMMLAPTTILGIYLLFTRPIHFFL